MRMRALLSATVLAALPFQAQAAGNTQAMTDFVMQQVAAWIAVPQVIEAVKQQNTRTGSYGADRVSELDQAWRAQIGSGSAPMIDEVMASDVSRFIAENVAGSGGAITEVFVMDAVGLNVAQSGVTSDYWQGDEAKHIETFGKGAGAVHVSEVELDESTQTYQAQVSVSLTDPETGAPIGAVTFGLNAEAFY